MSSEAAYRTAAAAGTAVISDPKSGLTINHLKAWKDPSMPLRERVAARIAHSVQAITEPKCIDVACAAGTDLSLLAAALDGKKANLHGIDLLEAQLVVAREKLPDVSFVQGDVLALPFPDAHFDSVQTSRLLVHIKDFRKAIDEMVRVLKPGGIGVFCEGEMDSGSWLLSSDERLTSVYKKKQEHIVRMITNPRAASETYKYLLSHADTQDVCMEAFSCCLPEPTFMDADMTHDKMFLKKLVDDGVLAQDDMDYYLAEATGRSAKEGNFLQLLAGPLEIHFRKK